MFYLEKSASYKVLNGYFHPVNYNGILNALSTIQWYISFLPLFRSILKNTTIPNQPILPPSFPLNPFSTLQVSEKGHES